MPDDLVRQIYDALSRGDIDGLLEFAHEDVEYVNPPYAVEPGVRTGHAGMRQVLANLQSSFAALRYEPLDVEQIGAEVVVRVAVKGHGGASGASIEGERHHVWTVRDGKIARLRWFASHEEADEAARS